ncbi:hypothetical protein KKA53_05195 [Candidatus Dependentiae bacterium]|nr:hypothetical protein [Candidatus Dependentiae bacterium]
MPLTDVEIEDLRFHLGYGNVGIGAYPYTPDGFYELFHDVVAPNLTEGDATRSITPVLANTITVVTPLSMTGIVDNAQLVVDTGDDAEIVWVKTAAAITFAARFLKAHTADGYPIMVNSGVARLRVMLNEANKAWQYAMSDAISKVGNLKGIGRKEVEWWSIKDSGGSAYDRAIEHYKGIVMQISSLVRVKPAWADTVGGACVLEAY